jgi:hypothetical protein
MKLKSDLAHVQEVLDKTKMLKKPMGTVIHMLGQKGVSITHENDTKKFGVETVLSKANKVWSMDVQSLCRSIISSERNSFPEQDPTNDKERLDFAFKALV